MVAPKPADYVDEVAQELDHSMFDSSSVTPAKMLILGAVIRRPLAKRAPPKSKSKAVGVEDATVSSTFL